MRLLAPISQSLGFLNFCFIYPYTIEEKKLKFRRFEWVKLGFILLICRLPELLMGITFLFFLDGKFDFVATMMTPGDYSFIDATTGIGCGILGGIINMRFFFLFKGNLKAISSLCEECFEVGSDIGSPVQVRVTDTWKNVVMKRLLIQTAMNLLGGIAQGILWYSLLAASFATNEGWFFRFVPCAYSFSQALTMVINYYGPFTLGAVNCIVLFFINVASGIFEDLATTTKDEIHSLKNGIRLGKASGKLVRKVNEALSPFLYFQVMGFLFSAVLAWFNLSSLVFASWTRTRILNTVTNVFVSAIYTSSLFYTMESGQRFIDAGKSVRMRLKKLVKEEYPNQLTDAAMYDMMLLLEDDLSEDNFSLFPNSTFTISNATYLHLVGSCLTYLIVLMQFKQTEEERPFMQGNSTITASIANETSMTMDQ